MKPIGPLSSPQAVRGATKAAQDAQRKETEQLRQGWSQRLAAASPEDLPRVKAEVDAEKAAHQAKRAYQAELRAAMITSAPGWVHPSARADASPPRSPEHKDGRMAGQILVEAYRRLGEKGRVLAATRGEEFAERHVEAVKLDAHDIEAIAEKLGGCSKGARQRATKLLERHIANEGPDGKRKLTFEAQKVFDKRITAFDEFRAAMMFDLSEHEEKLVAAQEKNKLKIYEKQERLENFARERKEHDKRIKKVQWTGETQDVRVDKSTNAKNVEFVVVNGRLVKAVKD